MTSHPDHRKQDPSSRDWDAVQRIFDSQTQPDKEPLHALLDGFRTDLKHHPYVRSLTQDPKTGSWAWFRTWPSRILIPATTLALLCWAIAVLARPAPSWGQVVARFEEVRFFSASIYMRDNGLAQPELMELWMGRGGKVRMRVGNQLIFAEKGEVLAAFDLKTRKQVDPDRTAVQMIQLLGSGETFSMDTILRGLNRGKAVTQTPIINPNAAIAEDLAVFDLETADLNEWFRIWTLKKSGLPIRIRSWNPSDAATVEVVFDYSEPQPEQFFDPKVFASALGTIKTDQLNLAYLYLQDPGGRFYVPGIPDQSEALALVTTSITGEPVCLAPDSDKVLLFYFWDRDYRQQDWDWLRAKQGEYGDGADVRILTVALDKDAERVKRAMADHAIDLPVLHESGKGLANGLARALGIKRGGTFVLLRRGRVMNMQYAPELNEEILDLACHGLDSENSRWITQFVEMFKTTQAQIRDLCGEPHATETQGDTSLWHYRFVSSDQARRQSLTIRFNGQGLYSGVAVANALIHPSRVTLQFSRAYWDAYVAAGSPLDPNVYLEIALAEGNRASIIGGGHPRTVIEPDRTYEREIEEGTYGLRLQWTHEKEYRIVKKIDLMDALRIGPNEEVSLLFSDTDQPRITRGEYKTPTRDVASETRRGLLARPDYKEWVRKANEERDRYDDPKYLPWQLHVKQIAALYETRPLPERMEILPKDTHETYTLTMFPKDLPGHEGYSAMSLEGDIKTRYRPLLVRWPADTPDMQLNHDLVYRNDVSSDDQFAFILKTFGYCIETVTEQRTVYVATYDGKTLPDPNAVVAPNAGGWGYFTARQLIDSLTRRMNPNNEPNAPIFLDETGLPSEPGPGRTFQDIAISMEMPGHETDLEALKTWFAQTFGIHFTEQTRPVEIQVIRR